MNKIKRYHKILHEWRHIPRAHEPKKPLAEKAKKILAEINLKMYPKKGCSEKDYITLDNERLSEITGCGRKQNKNLLRQLDNIFYIRFEQKFRYERKTHWNVYVIIPKHDAKEILENPELYYSQKTISPEKVENIEEYPTHEFPVTHHEISTPYIYTKEYNNKNRSISNFKSFKSFKEPRTLKSFYPLTEEQAAELRRTSGREFNLNAMNEILKDISKRLPDRVFYSDRGFMIYMSKIFAYEMRDAVKINNESFKIKSNIDPEERKMNEIEKYLSEIEDSLQVTPEWHLKKKLACTLKPETAFEVLRNYRRIDIDAHKAVIELNKRIELTEREKETILNQVRATHERLGETGIYIPITELEIRAPEYKQKENPSEETSSEPIERTGIWGEIRRLTADYFDRYKGKGSGDGIDRAWLSKLEAEVNEEQRQIKLKAPNDLCKSWIENNYAVDLRDAALSKGFNIREIYCY